MSVLRVTRRAMATTFELVVVGSDPRVLRAAAEAALDAVSRTEDALSTFLPTSAVSRLNRSAASGPVRVDPDLEALLARAIQLHRDTQGAFDLTCGPWMAAQGFRNAPAGTAGVVPGMGRVRITDGHVHFDSHVRFDGREVALDFGGIGKGVAIDRAVAVLRSQGITSAFLHGGTSTCYALGAPPGADGWELGVVDPSAPDVRLGVVRLRDQALAVSSSFGRVVQRDGRTIGHIVDPRTGRPVEHAAAWAQSPHATDADALSTAFLVLGAEGTQRYVGTHPSCGGAVLDDDLRAFGMAIESRREPRSPRGLSRRTFVKGAAAAAAFSVGLTARPARSEPEPAPTPLRVALVGVGEHGSLLLAQLVAMKEADVVALCDVRPTALKAGLALTGRDVETYADLAYLLEEEEPDVVVVASPTYAHAAHAVQALKAGAHVYCEAPMARTPDGCKQIVRAADAAKRVLHIGHQRRTSVLYPHAWKHVQSGAIGKVLQMRAGWNAKRSWRRTSTVKEEQALLDWRLDPKRSGGLLLEQGSHLFDLAHWFFKARPVAVGGFGSTLLWNDGRAMPDSIDVVVEYAGGRRLALGTHLLSSYAGERELIVGDAATILMRDQHKGLLFKEADTTAAGWEEYAKTEMLGKARGIVLDPMATKYELHDKPQTLGPDADKADFHAALQAFLTQVRKNEPAVCDGRAGLVAAVTAHYANQAVRERRVIELTEEHFDV